MMNKILTFITLLFAIVFVVIGLGWLFTPQFIGEQMDMRLLEGAGLSTQIADLASFFITMGSCILIGLKTKNRLWFYPPMIMLILAAIIRTIAWLFHGAALTIDMIAVEISVFTLLYFLSAKIPTKN